MADGAQEYRLALILGDVRFHNIDNDNNAINNEHGQMPCESFDRNAAIAASRRVFVFVYNSTFIRRHEFIP